MHQAWRNAHKSREREHHHFDRLPGCPLKTECLATAAQENMWVESEGRKGHKPRKLEQDVA